MEQSEFGFVTDEKLTYALNVLSDAFSRYFYYDRRGDEELSREDMRILIESGALTASMILEHIEKFLPEMLSRNFNLPV